MKQSNPGWSKIPRMWSSLICRALKEFRRVLKATGTLIVTSKSDLPDNWQFSCNPFVLHWILVFIMMSLWITSTLLPDIREIYIMSCHWPSNLDIICFQGAFCDAAVLLLQEQCKFTYEKLFEEESASLKSCEFSSPLQMPVLACGLSSL